MQDLGAGKVSREARILGLGSVGRGRIPENPPKLEKFPIKIANSRKKQK